MARFAKTISLLLLVASVAVFARAADPRVIQVRILPEAEVLGVEYTLAEIAEIDGFDLNAVRRLADLRIGASPLPGRTLRITETQLRSRLARMMGSHEIKLTVPENALVVRAGQLISGEEIARLVLEQARRGIVDLDGEVEQELVRPVGDVVLPRGETRWRVTPLGRHLAPGGSRTFRVTVTVAGREAWQSLVRVKQKAFRDVLVATRAIRRNRIIGEEDVTLVRKDVTGDAAERYFTSAGQAVGKHARRPIAKGEILHGTLVAMPPAVKEGGRVLVLYESPGVVVRALGVALVAGKVGDFIPVRNLQSGKVVYGIVQGNESIRVN